MQINVQIECADQLHHQMSSVCIQMPVLGCKVLRNTSRRFTSLVSMLCRSFFVRFKALKTCKGAGEEDPKNLELVFGNCKTLKMGEKHMNVTFI